MKDQENMPHVIPGGSATDDRGTLEFVNDFDMRNIKRFYTVTNHAAGFVRAWHAHKNEEKYVFCIEGSALFATIEIDHWEEPSSDLPIQSFILTSKNPSILYIPGGFAHGFKTLTNDTKVIFYSNSKLSESADDDYRYDAYRWNAWDIKER